MMEDDDEGNKGNQLTTVKKKLAKVKAGASFWQDLKALHVELGLV